MNKREKIAKISELLKRDYPIVVTPLLHKNVYELFVSVLLSPQTTDEVTNKVTPRLFEKYRNFEELSIADESEILSLIRVINYNKTKSKNLLSASKMIMNDFGGEVPTSLDELMKLPGVGRKVGNVVISEWFAKSLYQRGSPILSKDDIDNLPLWEKSIVLSEGFVVDTHVIRTSQRLGLSKHKDPKKIEQDLMKVFPREEWNDMSLRLIFHGRNRCKAQNPQCYLDEEWREVCACAKKS